MIADGNWVAVRRQPDADSGDIVAAMFASESSADSEATARRSRRPASLARFSVR